MEFLMKYYTPFLELQLIIIQCPKPQNKKANFSKKYTMLKKMEEFYVVEQSHTQVFNKKG